VDVEKVVFKRNVTFLIYYTFRIKALLRLGFRVGCPLVGHDLNVTDGRPPEVFP